MTVRRRPVAMTREGVADAIRSGFVTEPEGTPIRDVSSVYDLVTKYRPRFDREDIAAGLEGPWRHLAPIYRLTGVGFDQEVGEERSRKHVIMASAQSGKTAFEVLAVSYVCLVPAWGCLLAMYFPNADLPGKYARDRIRPMFKGTPSLSKLFGAPREDGSDGVENMSAMNIGPTMLYLMTIAGKTATEGVPLKGIFADEVRRMAIGDLERAEQRYAAQVDPWDIKVSTPGLPDSNIDVFFKRGDQRNFHTECRCSDGLVIPKAWPDCVVDLRTASREYVRKVEHAFSHAGLPYLGATDEKRKEYPPAVYACPRCGEIIVDPRRGWWEPHNPAAGYLRSWQFGKALSPISFAGEVLDKYEKAKDMQEFYNSELGLAYVNESQRPLKPSDVDACVRRELVWGEQMAPRERALACQDDVTLGADVQAGYGIVVILGPDETGVRPRVLHLEVAHVPVGSERTWWHRLGVLMQRYRVRLAVVDEQPEYTQSLEFCNAFRSRVYLANYNLGDNADRRVVWEELKLAGDPSQRGENAIRWKVSIQRTKVLHWTVMQWKLRRVTVPTLDTLAQVLPTQRGEVVFSPHLEVGSRERKPVSVGRILQDHLCRFVFRDVLDSDSAAPPRRGMPTPRSIGKTKQVAEHMGSSPDFAHATLYASIAFDKIRGNTLGSQ